MPNPGRRRTNELRSLSLACCYLFLAAFFIGFFLAFAFAFVFIAAFAMVPSLSIYLFLSCSNQLELENPEQFHGVC